MRSSTLLSATTSSLEGELPTEASATLFWPEESTTSAGAAKLPSAEAGAPKQKTLAGNGAPTTAFPSLAGAANRPNGPPPAGAASEAGGGMKPAAVEGGEAVAPKRGAGVSTCPAPADDPVPNIEEGGCETSTA